MKITYRAQFRQPRGVLNPLNVTVRAVVTVELFEGSRCWIAREIDSRDRRVFERLGYHPGIDAAMTAVQNAFAEQLGPWQMYDTEGYPLSPDEITIAPDGTVTRKPLTHITDFAAEAAERKAGKHRSTVHTPCAQNVSPKAIVSVKADIAPTCRTCREVYEREYAHAGKL